MFGIYYVRIHPARALGKTDRDLCQKRLFPVWTLWFVHLKCAVFVILFLCYCRFLVLMYRVVLIGVEFVEIHPDMSEGENKFILCIILCKIYSLLPGGRNTFYFPYSWKFYFLEILNIALDWKFFSVFSRACNTLYLTYSETFCKLQWILWTFLCRSSVAYLILNRLPSSEILKVALDWKLSFVFLEPSMGWTL